MNSEITPTNGNPTDYTVSINVRSHGKIIAQFKTTEKLTQNQIISFERYIPLKTDEMPLIDSVERSITKLPNLPFFHLPQRNSAPTLIICQQNANRNAMFAPIKKIYPQ